MSFIKKNLVVYIPLFNGEVWCRDFVPSSLVSYVAIDNCSTDNGAKILADKGVLVVSNSKALGRVGNWAACIEHFLSSDFEWMKWLFVGDTLLPGFEADFERLIVNYPSARIVAGDYYHVEGGQRIRASIFTKTRIFSPAESMKAVIEFGGWFGPPSAVYLHRDSLLRGWSFGTLDYVADMYFFQGIARHCDAVYWRRPVAEFRADCRKYYKEKRNKISAVVEIWAVQADVLDWCETNLPKPEFCRLRRRLLLEMVKYCGSGIRRSGCDWFSGFRDDIRRIYFRVTRKFLNKRKL